MEGQQGFSAAIASCPADCPGRRSPWHTALGGEFACPLGIPFCGCWNPEVVAVKHVRKHVADKEIAA